MGSLRKTIELSFPGPRAPFSLASLRESFLSGSIKDCVARLLFKCLLVGLKCEHGSRSWKGRTDLLEPHSPAGLNPSLSCHSFICSEPGATLPQWASPMLGIWQDGGGCDLGSYGHK